METAVFTKTKPLHAVETENTCEFEFRGESLNEATSYYRIIDLLIEWCEENKVTCNIVKLNTPTEYEEASFVLRIPEPAATKVRLAWCTEV